MPELRRSKSFESNKSDSSTEGGKVAGQRTIKGKRTGFDFDIDDSWFNEYDKREDMQKTSKWQSFKETRRLSSNSNQDGAEFDVNDEIFREKEESIEDLSSYSPRKHHTKTDRSDDEYKPVKQDLFGRHLSNDESLGASWSGLDNSSSGSNFLTKMQMSNSSSASSRHSSNSYTHNTGSFCSGSVTASRSTLRGRSFSSNSLNNSRSPSRDRRLSAGSFSSVNSMPHSPGHPRKVNSSNNVLLPGLGGQNKHGHNSKQKKAKPTAVSSSQNSSRGSFKGSTQSRISSRASFS